ncbi:uncharacterized protein SCO4629-like [Mytilus galloprovincialis]|uniref:uncharacterized protein SCO4629-like n=1 Tax=Mytilus galloprovincialis TaxID=29158 RepID=UPI003F7C03D0
MPNEESINQAEVIWNYLKLNHTLEKSDLIIVFGNPDIRTIEYASKLWLDGFAKWLMITGNEGTLTKGKWQKPEAQIFKDIAVSQGVPEEKILLEEEATNTGENVTFSYQILEKLGLLDSVKTIILVQMPFMERRTYATFAKQWPGGMNQLDRVCVTSPAIDLMSYPNDDVGDLDKIMEMMVGCLQRVKNYPKLGFQIEQDIPDNVWNIGENFLPSGKY